MVPSAATAPVMGTVISQCSAPHRGVPWPVAYWILKVLLTPVFYLLWRVKVEGREHVPAHGPAVLAANHQSFCDSFFVPLVLRRRVTFVAKAEYFDRWRTAWFFRAVGQIPMQRCGGDASQRALDAAKQVLLAGKLVGIYPEGTRAPDVRLHKGHTGAARLALGCGVPVIPVGLIGTSRVQPTGCRVLRPFHPVTVRFGPPLADERHRSTTDGGPAGPDPLELRRFTDRLMEAIGRLSGQERVDRYANGSDDAEPAAHSQDGAGSGDDQLTQHTPGRRSHVVTDRKQRVHTDGLP